LDEQYESTATDISTLKARAAYLDGELCAVNPDGTTSFAELQAAPDSKSTTHLVYFVFDLLLPTVAPACGMTSMPFEPSPMTLKRQSRS
jgi:ATP-dependent DNA ligase